jgi:hypothetical protein
MKSKINLPGFMSDGVMSINNLINKSLKTQVIHSNLFTNKNIFPQLVGGGSGGGQGFSCNEPGNPGKCNCTGPADSADCKAMEKNCSGPISCGWLVDDCTCDFKAIGPGPVKKPPLAPRNRSYSRLF